MVEVEIYRTFTLFFLQETYRDTITTAQNPRKEILKNSLKILPIMVGQQRKS